MSRKRTLDAKQPIKETIHYMTPNGYKTLADEQDYLVHIERPKITEIVSWAAGNGDRSENGDYIYNKKRLREIDGRLRYLKKKLEDCKIVDPKDQQGLERIYFGATVTYAKCDDEGNESEITVHLVGIDEADFDPKDPTKCKINWLSPVGKALQKAEEGDIVKVRTEDGIEEIEVIEIRYILD
ncbi:MAG: transcription elongation factor GreB [Alphaproteobacteria bacterium]|nr:transcription elongation factor GreB [Alphaproteobacteria bacterium]